MCETIIACAIAASRLRALQLRREQKGACVWLFRIDQKSEEPLYLQIRSQIIAAIATGRAGASTALPSVRAGWRRGINLHTVNKARTPCARDRGYVLMRGRSGRYRRPVRGTIRPDPAQIQAGEDGGRPVRAGVGAPGAHWRHVGRGSWSARMQGRRAYGAGERSDAELRKASRDAQGGTSKRAASYEPAFKGVRCSGRVRPDRHNGRYGIAHYRSSGAFMSITVPHAPRRGVHGHRSHLRAALIRTS